MNLEELRQRKRELEEQIRQQAGVTIREEFEVIFQKYANIESFSWTQYTPYFNDGEACTFEVHSDPHINDSSESYYLDEDEAKEIGFESRKQCREASQAIQKLIESYSYEELEDLFGEGRIVVSRDGVTIKDYDHD